MATFGVGERRALAAAAQQLGLSLVDTYGADESDLAALRARLASEPEPATVLVAVPDPGERDRLLVDLLRMEAVGARLLDAQGEDPLSSVLDTATARAPSTRGERIRATMARKAMRGLVLGRIPFGYRAGPEGSLEEAPEEAAVVRDIFRLAAGGKGIRAIVKELNARGLRTRRGGPWSMITVRDMLRNRVYTGTYDRFGARVTGNHPALVSLQEFRAVQARLDAMAQRAGYGPGGPFLLSGIAVCGACGSRMIGVTRRQTWRRQDGSRSSNVYRYYQCEAATNQGRCSYHTRRAPELETEVLAALGPQSLAGAARAALETRLRTLAREAAAGRRSVVALREAVAPLQRAASVLEQAPAHEVGTDAASEASSDALLKATADPALRSLLREALQNRLESVAVDDDAVRVAVRR